MSRFSDSKKGFIGDYLVLFLVILSFILIAVTVIPHPADDLVVFESFECFFAGLNY